MKNTKRLFLGTRRVTKSITRLYKRHIRQLVEEGKIYLFRITNRDMSEYNKGTPSMFTKYFRMLFSKENDGTYKLNGEAEMFFRDKLIRDSERVIHPAGQPIMNKNPYNSKKESVFVYDIIKDKHYTEHKYLLHMSFTGNFKADGCENINANILEEIKKDECNNIIGIDRGENNLLYVTVINEKGEILEQRSLNSFKSGNGMTVDYQELIKKREQERVIARHEWKQINSIAALKEGYLSRAVKEIADLAVKYKAIIVMEDLSVPFMDCRAAIETQVYKKAETSLKNKLSFLIDKDTPDDEKGGLMHPYQLVCKPGDSITGIQNGALFKVNAWKTSKIDPVTGFSDLIYMKYSSIESSSQMFKLFDDIFYDSQEDLFVFRTDYSKFPRARISSTKYDICTYGDRIERYRDPDNIYHWCTRKIFLTEEFKKLFKEYKIDYRTNLKKQITEQQTATFFKRIIKLYQLTVQVRNSVSGSNKREDDYIISPVKGYDGKFFDSRYCDNTLPQDADANGAYNIARKGLILVKKMKEGGEKPNLSISSKEWLEFANLGLNIK